VNRAASKLQEAKGHARVTISIKVPMIFLSLSPIHWLASRDVSVKKQMESRNQKPTVAPTVINVTREGDWLPPDELHAVARSAVNAEGNLIVNLRGVDHLDASAFQILLALAKERKRQEGALILAEASTALSRWFEYAGERGNICPEPEA
jgi:anti-anti-sigma factor